MLTKSIQGSLILNLSRINAGGKNSSLTAKKAAKPVSSDACRPCGVNFKISVGDFGGKKEQYISTENLFKISERADKIRLAIVLKIHRGVEIDPQDGKSSRKRETASFCPRFNTNLQDYNEEADRRS